MSIAGIGSSLGDAGSQYDFAKMSNRQLYSAATTLQSEGKISIDQMSTMEYVAQGGNSVSVDGTTGPTGFQVLNQAGSTDFAAEFQAMYQSVKETPGSVGTALYKSIADLMSSEDSTAAKSGLSAVA